MRDRSEKPGEVNRRKLQFTITCYAPVEASIGEVKDYIEDSLCWAGGCRHPGDEETETDPLFHSLDKVEAKRIIKRRKK